MYPRIIGALSALALLAAGPALAGSMPAKLLFGNAKDAAPLEARSIGSYARGCVAGAVALPVDGPAWQAMRLSRNRNWGHPVLVDVVKRLATDGKALDGWSGLLVGDMSQPRGGPMLSGHASHQIGLDADVWLTPMPERTLSYDEREEIAATSMLKTDAIEVDPNVWTDRQARIIRRAATYPEVARIFVHPAIKKALCDFAGDDRAWLRKVRPWWGHYYHFHIRINCPPGNPGCSSQNPPPEGDGCGAELASWLAPEKWKPAPPPDPNKPMRLPKQKTLADLPDACRMVVEAMPGGVTEASLVPLPPQRPPDIN